LLFGEVRERKMELASALRVVKQAQKKTHRVRQLLRELGDDAEAAALSLRFQRLRRRMEARPPGESEQLERYAELTLAVHDLNVLLSGAFYP